MYSSEHIVTVLDDPYIGIVMRNNSHAVAYLKSPLVKISPPTAVSPPSPATSYISAVGKKDPTDVPQVSNRYIPPNSQEYEWCLPNS